MPPRQPLTARLEDLTAELEALRLFRRQRIITDARAFKRQRDKLLQQIANVQDRIEEQRRVEEERRQKKTKQRADFVAKLTKNFQEKDNFKVKIGNKFMSDEAVFDAIARQPGRWVLQAGEKYYTLNDRTRVRFNNILVGDLIKEQYEATSDGQFAAEAMMIGNIGFSRVEEVNINDLEQDAFFKYTHNTYYDFSRYGIFTFVDPKNYEDNCLIYAMKLSNVSDEIIEDLKLRMKNRYIPKSDLKKIAEQYDLTIILRTGNQEKNKVKPFVYGTGNTIVSLGALDNHYFINEKTTNTRFSLEHYDEVKNEKNSHSIIAKRGKYFERSEDRYIDSYDLVKLLLEKKETLLNEITMNDQMIATTQFYDKVDTEIKCLEYDEKKCSRPVEMPGKSKDEGFKNVFFDFETYTKVVKNDKGDDVKLHIPYLVCMYDGTTKRTFYGKTCGQQMLFALTGNTRLIAHNANYDYRFIIPHLTQIEELSRGNRLISSKAIFNGYEVQVKDSFHLISMALKKFPKTFGIKNVVKEVMPYDLYTEDTIKQRWINAEEVAKKYINEKDQTQFFDNIQKWKLMNEQGEYDIVEYSKRYCEIDCEILAQGYNTFRQWILDLVQIDIDGILTIASLAHRYFIAQKCYEGVNELSGIPQAFIQGAVVGGRTMCAENKKIKIEGKINDFDAVSLYPSAMRRMDGFLKGKPKILKNLTYDFLQKQDGYFVDIRILSVGVQRKFPLMSYKNDDGVRIFSNDMVGKIIRVDRYTLEDLIQFQGITFEVLRGYYFNEGFNTKINEVIKFLFDERLRMKKEGNPAQEVYKLIMNSGYGKSIMKPVDTETRFFDDEHKFKVFLARHYNWITCFVRFGKKIKVSMVKTLNDHFNIAHVGTTILSMSKRIMNEVMCLAEDNGLEVYYQDTDSNHILDKDIEVLASLFKQKYGRELIGKGFGQFHSDFEIDGATDVYSRRAIFLGKKCYIDELVGKKDGKEVIDYHIRMKGIPNSCILHTAGKMGYATPFDMYADLYNGKQISFDLTNDGSKANFKFQKDYSVNTLSMFTRTIKFA